MEFYSNSTIGVASGVFAAENEAVVSESRQGGLTAEDVAAIVNNALASLRVYVVESDITSAQNSVRAVVEQALF